MERMYVAVCNECGVMVIVQDRDTAAQTIQESIDTDDEPMIARCGILYVLDSGTEECPGNLVLRGQLDLLPLS